MGQYMKMLPIQTVFLLLIIYVAFGYHNINLQTKVRIVSNVSNV